MTQTTYIEPEGFKGTTGPLINWGFDVFDAKGKRIADCWTIHVHDGEGKHNAELFAASKDLLRELQGTAGLLEAHEIIITEEDYPESNKQLREAFTSIYAAINKALGNLSNTTDNG